MEFNIFIVPALIENSREVTPGFLQSNHGISGEEFTKVVTNIT